MRPETILVIDDNRQIGDYLAKTILPSLGYTALLARDGFAGMRLIQEHKDELDLILLDLQLPDINGLDLLRRMNQDGYEIPAILVTAHGSEQVAVDAFRLGVQDYLNKPVDIEILQAAISRALVETRLRREKEALNSQLQERVVWMEALSQVGRSLTSTLDLDEVLRRIVEAAVSLTHADEGFLALLDAESGQLYLRAAKNIDQDQIETMRLPITDSLVGNVLKSRRPLRALQPTQGRPQLKVSTGYLVYSLLHVPILSREEPLGVLSVDNRTTHQAFEDQDEALLNSLADYAAVALENASLYQKSRQELLERERVEAALRVSEQRYALAVSGANDGLWDWDMRANRVYYSPRWKTMLGYVDYEISDAPNEWFQRVHPDDLGQLKMNISAHIKGLADHFECEYRMRHKDGSTRWIRSRGIAVWDAEGNVHRMAGSQSDITQRKQFEQRLVHDALYDPLTGLPNRTLFMDHLHHAIEHARRRQDYLYAVLFMDLDRFKDINDSLGHQTGDQLLIATARLLETTLRPVDTVARLGGDEFVILLEDIADAEDATQIANRIQKKLMAASLLAEQTIFVTASIGIVLSQTGYERPDDVLRDADIAMYRAKANGRARYEIFDANMRHRIMERISLEAELQQAIERKELQVAYQPIIGLGDGKLVGFEALVRWRHPQRGMILPTEFIPMAEETGMIILIDRWVMREACRQTQAWQKSFPHSPPLSINVNISGKQVTQTDFVETVKRILDETGLPPASLHLEITENAIMENFDLTSDVLERVRGLGVELQIDDFGIGYSSLNYLSRFPLHALKIDQSFISMMGDDSSYHKIVQAIVRLTHGLGMSVIAEGVETEAQLHQLQALECEYVQGSLISMPLDGMRVTQMLGRATEGEQTSLWEQA
ncbi:MAG TPA: EAL domain-containing protein [Anaerolineales bacterium]|nr:EAL domain-containing protein [Anaerolineales bacterium]